MPVFVNLTVFVELVHHGYKQAYWYKVGSYEVLEDIYLIYHLS